MADTDLTGLAITARPTLTIRPHGIPGGNSTSGRNRPGAVVREPGLGVRAVRTPRRRPTSAAACHRRARRPVRCVPRRSRRGASCASVRRQRRHGRIDRGQSDGTLVFVFDGSADTTFWNRRALRSGDVDTFGLVGIFPTRRDWRVDYPAVGWRLRTTQTSLKGILMAYAGRRCSSHRSNTL